jgi:two-component system response regulator DesR
MALPPPAGQLTGVKGQDARLNVLIADDSSVVRERLAALLEDLPGVRIVSATASVRATLASVRRRRPDLVILDLNMPDGSTLDALRQIGAEQVQSAVVVLTTDPSPEYRQRALELGAKAFFDKSHEFMKVRELVRELAARGTPRLEACHA